MLNRTEQNLKARGDRDCICAHEAHVVEQSIPPSAHGVGRAPNYRFVALSTVPLVDATSKNQGTTEFPSLLVAFPLQRPSQNP